MISKQFFITISFSVCSNPLLQVEVDLGINGSKNFNGLFVGQVDPGLCLRYCGPVSCTSSGMSKDSFEICKFLGLPFHMSGANLNTPNVDFGVPAWMVKVSNKSEENHTLR